MTSAQLKLEIALVTLPSLVSVQVWKMNAVSNKKLHVLDSTIAIPVLLLMIVVLGAWTQVLVLAHPVVAQIRFQIQSFVQNPKFSFRR